ncbi:hypothetical protein [Chryseobacterium sp. R2ACT005]|uniref:hypothetical protein n=1 Tax=Chryseobacterium sp. R2ACT005 TaxID=3416668 RepID=UPI003CE78A47
MSNRRFLTYSLVIAGSQYSLNIEINILRFADAYVDVNKAMILPKIASPHLNIVNPAAGMMVYDTTKKQLAIYNGTVWSFWKP